MEHRFEVFVTRKHTGSALRRFLLRDEGIFASFIYLITVVLVVYDARDGRLHWISIVILTLLGMLLLAYVVAFWLRRSQTDDLLRRLGDSPIQYLLGEEEIRTESILGSSSVKWEMVRQIWIYPDLVMVFFSRNTYITIPGEQIPTAALEFLRAKAASHEARVVDRRK
jgi:hypothetical protein